MIVITGATGFLGSHLLPHLLTTTPVLALVRDEPQHALRRLVRAVAATGADRELLDALPALVRTVRVELTAPRLGLSEHAYRELAEHTEQLWHCAALTTMTADPGELRAANVTGTRRILHLADHAPAARVFHVSTAYVCGARQGLVREDDLEHAAGFLNPYESSKYQAELLLRGWAAARSRNVTVFRPSVLVSNRPRPRRTPRHPLSVLGSSLRLLAEQLDLSAPIRLAGSPTAGINLLPVEYAARAMATAGAAAPRRPVDTHHVVHHHDTPVPLVLQAMTRDIPGLRLLLTADHRQLDATDREFAELTAGLHRYAGRHVRFDRGRLDASTAGLSPPAPITLDYLQHALRS